jgi:nucleotide-binding universal stress UspA family protein
MSFAYQTILCPTDLSAAGDDAVDLAYALAAPKGVVHLLHVLEPAYLAVPFDTVPAVMAIPPEVVEASEKRAKQHLKRLIPEEALLRNVRTDVQVVHDVGVASAIEREAKRVGAEVLVVGTHGRRGVSNLLMGSVATHLLKTSHLPVILVRPRRT